MTPTYSTSAEKPDGVAVYASSFGQSILRLEAGNKDELVKLLEDIAAKVKEGTVKDPSSRLQPEPSSASRFVWTDTHEFVYGGY